MSHTKNSTYKKKNYKSGKKCNMSKPCKKEVHKMITNELRKESETKQVTAGISYTGISAGVGSFLKMTDIAPGNAYNQRVGDQIYVKHIQVRMSLQNNLGASSNPFNDIRVIVFQFKSQQAAPSSAEMFITSVLSGNVPSAYSARNPDFLSIYNILYDRVVHVEQGSPNASNYGASGQYAKYLKFNVPLKYAKRKVVYNSATTAVNGIWMCLIGSSASVASNPTVGVDFNINYTDS